MEKGNSSDDCLPKFFKVYLPDDSGDDLDIPISFNSCLSKSLPKTVIVRSIYGNVWKLNLRKCCGGGTEKFSMVDGWKRIVKDEDLKGGEFLAFEFDGSRLFNFCIYDQATCKRLGNSDKTKEIEHESDGEDDVVVIDEDDVIDDQDYDDDDGNAEAADIDDDDDVEVADIDGDVEAEALDVDDDSEADDDDHRQYLDDPDNPSFTVILNPKKKSQLLIPTHVVKDYNLNFPERITVVDPLVNKFGTLEKEIKVQDNGKVFVKGFGSVFRRNNVKPTDKMICEVKQSGCCLVHTIKVYICKGMISP